MTATATFRPPAVPLINVDPYFSLWSTYDALYEGDTCHWTGATQPLRGYMRIDGVPYCFLGKPQPLNVIRKTGMVVDALTTRCFFEGHGVAVEVAFTTPLLPDDLDLLSRPVGFVRVAVRCTDAQPHALEVHFAVSPLLCVNSPEQEVLWESVQLSTSRVALRVGSREQPVLQKDGDNLRIDWGYLYLTAEGRRGEAEFSLASDWAWRQGTCPDVGLHTAMGPMPASAAPLLCAAVELGCVESDRVAEAVFAVAYDDVLAVEYFGRPLRAYWHHTGQTFTVMLDQALDTYPEVLDRCKAFDAEMNSRAVEAGGDAYRDLCALAYRQAIAGHRLVADEDGAPLLFSKECFSNGCMSTVDVAYPSSPLFLLYNAELLHGMLRPVFAFAHSEAWPYEFAPHDVGRYPKANGQVYGRDRDTGDYLMEAQMPIEECANMLIMTAAAARTCGSAAFAMEHWDLLAAWAEHLIAHGADPGAQLCSDDFCGRLGRNANLAVKACVGVAAFGLLCDMAGLSQEAARAHTAARTMSRLWLDLADDGDHYRLAFDLPGTWSLKYNLLWDKLLGLGLFPQEVYDRELRFYEKQMLAYGVPLDNRHTFTKSDWYVWCACLHDSNADFARWIERLWRSLNDSISRVPFTDWYYADTAVQRGFQHRTVVGALFARLLQDDA